jgi:elongation factor P
MIDAGDLKKGLTIELDGELYRVLDYHHIKMGRGSAQVRLRLRDIRAGHTIERSFQASEKFAPARLESHSMQYLYQDGGLFYFMDVENFEQMPLTPELLGEALSYLKEGMTLELLSYRDKPVGVELPTAVELTVIDTGPSFKGNTATPGTKPATLETGLAIQVPLFINNGDVVKVDTRSGEYLERAG